MKKLAIELNRLYLPARTLSSDVLARRMLGESIPAIGLSTDDGMTRAMVMAFNKKDGDEEAQHWHHLCTVANALQTQLGFPAPAVSISGANGYCLWLSLTSLVQGKAAQEFLTLVRAAFVPDMDDDAGDTADLPPCLHQATGRWAAFINPGLGASFADESGLEMAPPLAGQAALLEGLESISDAQFQQALATLQQAQPTASERPASPDGLLLRDATLEDIVNYLHSKNIEPTFRHVINHDDLQLK